VIDRPQFDRQRAAGQFGSDRRKASHAQNHRESVAYKSCRLEDGRKRNDARPRPKNDERILYFIAAVVENVELIPLTCKS
jgi:hypothetical protein